jgi:hypothetical protein
MNTELLNAMTAYAKARVAARVADVTADYYIITNNPNRALQLLNERDEYISARLFWKYQIATHKAQDDWDKLMNEAERRDNERRYAELLIESEHDRQYGMMLDEQAATNGWMSESDDYTINDNPVYTFSHLDYDPDELPF